MRTLEEIAKALDTEVFGLFEGGRKPVLYALRYSDRETLIVAALREAIAQRDAEWKDAAGVVADSELLGPKPIIEHAQARAVAQERAALREQINFLRGEVSAISQITLNILLDWLDAREKV